MWRRRFWNTGSRYGWDNLSRFLVLLSLILITWEYTLIMGVVIGVYSIWRIFSNDIEKRKQEQAAFDNLVRKLAYRLNIFYYKSGISKLGQKIRSYFSMIKQRRKYLVIHCPNCSQKLRLPKHRGVLLVTCKNCSFKFKKKT